MFYRHLACIVSHTHYWYFNNIHNTVKKFVASYMSVYIYVRNNWLRPVEFLVMPRREAEWPLHLGCALFFITVIKLTWNYLCIKRFYCIPASQSESSIQTDHGIIPLIPRLPHLKTSVRWYISRHLSGVSA